MTRPHHRIGEHVGELAIELWAPELAELYAEAARALAGLLEGPAQACVDGSPRSVSVSAPDRDALLVEWLNEVIFLSEVEGMVYPGVRILFVDGRRLEAELRGHPIEHPAVAVKAATFHGLHVHEVNGGLGATVVLDI